MHTPGSTGSHPHIYTVCDSSIGSITSEQGQLFCPKSPQVVGTRHSPSIEQISPFSSSHCSSVVQPGSGVGVTCAQSGSQGQSASQDPGVISQSQYPPPPGGFPSDANAAAAPSITTSTTKTPVSNLIVFTLFPSLSQSTNCGREACGAWRGQHGRAIRPTTEARLECCCPVRTRWESGAARDGQMVPATMLAPLDPIPAALSRSKWVNLVARGYSRYDKC